MLDGKRQEANTAYTKTLEEYVDFSLNVDTEGKVVYGDTIKQKLFYEWYRAGKPSLSGLKKLTEKLLLAFDRKPSESTLNAWLNEFKKEALRLDTSARDIVDKTVVAEKVEMLIRHTLIGRKMQDAALLFFEEHPEEINAAAATRLLVEGVRIERESAGIPDALGKMSSMSDEQLLEELKKIVSSSPISSADLLIEEE